MVMKERIKLQNTSEKNKSVEPFSKVISSE